MKKPTQREQMAYSTIARLEAELAQLKAGGWIAIKDRLPPLGERLDAPCEVGGRTIPPLNRSVEVIVFANGGVFSTTVEWFDGEEKPTSNITHWQPLPQPPTE